MRQKARWPSGWLPSGGLSAPQSGQPPRRSSPPPSPSSPIRGQRTAHLLPSESLLLLRQGRRGICALRGLLTGPLQVVWIRSSRTDQTLLLRQGRRPIRTAYPSGATSQGVDAWRTSAGFAPAAPTKSALSLPPGQRIPSRAYNSRNSAAAPATPAPCRGKTAHRKREGYRFRAPGRLRSGSRAY